MIDPKQAVQYTEDKVPSEDDPLGVDFEGFQLIGYIWKKAEHERRWVFTTGAARPLGGSSSSYPKDARFIPVYAEVSFKEEDDLYT